MPLFPTIITTGSRCRTSESTSISEKPAAPSPSSTTTCRSGCTVLRRDRIAHPAAETAVRAGVEPGAGLVDLDVLAGVRHEVAAVADDDRVGVEHLAQLTVDPGRLDRVGVGGEQWRLGGELGVLGGAQLGDPVGVVDTVAAVVGEPTQDRRDVAGDRRNVDVCRDPGGGVDDVGDGGVTEPAEPDTEVERRADDDDEVGALLEQPAGAEEGERVAGRQHAATRAR